MNGSQQIHAKLPLAKHVQICHRPEIDENDINILKDIILISSKFKKNNFEIKT